MISKNLNSTVVSGLKASMYVHFLVYVPLTSFFLCARNIEKVFHLTDEEVYKSQLRIWTTKCTFPIFYRECESKTGFLLRNEIFKYPHSMLFTIHHVSYSSSIFVRTYTKRISERHKVELWFWIALHFLVGTSV